MSKQPIRKYYLTKKNLEECGWLFSAKLGIMVHEHECSGGMWDIEVDGYKLVGGSDGKWEPDTNIYNVYETFELMSKDQPELLSVKDWIHGDDVEMW